MKKTIAILATLFAVSAYADSSDNMKNASDAFRNNYSKNVNADSIDLGNALEDLFDAVSGKTTQGGNVFEVSADYASDNLVASGGVVSRTFELVYTTVEGPVKLSVVVVANVAGSVLKTAADSAGVVVSITVGSSTLLILAAAESDAKYALEAGQLIVDFLPNVGYALQNSAEFKVFATQKVMDDTQAAIDRVSAQ